MSQVFNFGAGPAMLPPPVMQKIKEELLDYQNLGSSVIEISHRSKEFNAILEKCTALFQELTNLPENYRVLYVHGGARMQFSAIPLNLIGRKPSRKALYFETGNFSKLAIKDAARYGNIEVLASSAETNYDRIPEYHPGSFDDEASYIQLTSNNTIYGTRWNTFPKTGEIPLVVDATSEILSRTWDYSQFGVVFAGLQKNLGPSGLAVVVIREDLLGLALPETPLLLDYAELDKSNSLTNTINTFALYVMCEVLQWLKDQGGVTEIEKRNEEKAQLLYDQLETSQLYKSVAHPDHRSTMNVTFNLTHEELLEPFLNGAKKAGLTALKGHRNVGGVRASIYNAMPIEGVKALCQFMKDFEATN